MRFSITFFIYRYNRIFSRDTRAFCKKVILNVIKNRYLVKKDCLKAAIS